MDRSRKRNTAGQRPRSAVLRLLGFLAQVEGEADHPAAQLQQMVENTLLKRRTLQVQQARQDELVSSHLGVCVEQMVCFSCTVSFVKKRDGTPHTVEYLYERGSLGASSYRLWQEQAQ